MFEILKIKRFKTPIQISEIDDKIVSEVPLTITLNGEELVTLLCSPAHLKELAVGYLTAEGFIDSSGDVNSVLFDEKANIIRVNTRKEISEAVINKKRIITSGCGRGQSFYHWSDFENCRKIESDFKANANAILSLMLEFQKKSLVFMETGGVHSAALSDDKSIIAFFEDIGRHNAVDKIVGEIILHGGEIKDKILLLSGRISSEIVIKAVRLGVPIIVSRSAPTTMAVRLAEKLNISLIGFARGTRMNIYSGSQRIII
ncbi:MAG: FdhD protein [Candidatus Saganbacteria bacterium]|uniref:Sulfur carrier protein FdhD n=1 Tax=Candidatus Saganbacteria bacterium TaxID=2575572 RepID=A0A833L1T4_UNCSA|nr:MAG: FdhD protein [Candidatus Saganbacteria bacterium]